MDWLKTVEAVAQVVLLQRQKQVVVCALQESFHDVVLRGRVANEDEREVGMRLAKLGQTFKRI